MPLKPKSTLETELKIHRPNKLSYGDLTVGNSLDINEYVNISEGIHDEMLLEVTNPQELKLFYGARSIGKSMFNELYREYLKDASFGSSCTTTANPCSEISLDHIREASGFLSNHQSNQVKESNKMNVNNNNRSLRVETLIGLASANAADEFSKYDQMPEGLKEALKRKSKEQADAKADAAAETILNLVSGAEAAINSRVDDIRRLRRQVEQLKTEITEIETAKEYGMSSQNFLPLARGLGYHVMQVEERELLNVPSNFKMKAAKK